MTQISYTSYKSTNSTKNVILIHGLLGNKSNLRFIAKRLQTLDYNCYTIDLPDHGQSNHIEKFSFTSYANIVHKWMKDKNIQTAHIIGHSLGGKVAMAMSAKYAKSVNSIVAMDIAPRKYKSVFGDMFKALIQIDTKKLSSRSEASKLLEKDIPKEKIRQFLLQGLVRGEDDCYKWNYNLESFAKNIKYIGANPLGENEKTAIKTLFMRAENSEHIVDEDIELINHHFLDNKIINIKDASHWLHADQPKLVLNTIIDWLNEF
jgi:pimeloyl-ACP methyl ester carboxylesterase